MTKFIYNISLFLIAVLVMQSCGNSKKTEPATQAEKLGFKKGKKVLIIHADDAGMCPEANISIEKYLENGEIKSTSVMMPCPSAEPMVEWAKKHPGTDLGIHLTLTSEWKTYRWSSVSDTAKVPGLIDPDGKFWHEVPGVVAHASAGEVETEIRAQIEKAKSLGWQPTHLDSHMGTLFGSPGYIKVYLKVSEEYNIPAAIVDFSDEKVVAVYREMGYPITDEVIKMVDGYKLPKLDFYTYVPKGGTYDELKENFFKMVKSLKPGLVQVFFHPSVYSENLKTITNSWQRRVWEAKLFSDPEVKEFLATEGVVITNWIEVMEKFNAKNR